VHHYSFHRTHIVMAMLLIKDGGIIALPTSTVIATVFVGKVSGYGMWK